MSLKTLGARADKARDALKAACAKRDEAICEAYDSGDYSMIEIAEEVGLSRQQVWEILNPGRRVRRKAG